uniref:Uncharacterized protein n=1 Tax=Oxyrrhis marina TaxID=2969 RepID=A0A7S4GKK5_OXYMA
MPDELMQKDDASRLLRVWSAGLILKQVVLLIGPAIGVSCAGAGLAQAPLWVWFHIAGWCFFAFGTELLVCGDRPACQSNFSYTMPSTVLNIFDVCTDALAAGVMLASYNCEDCRLEATWEQVAAKSALPVSIPLWSIALLAWLATLPQCLMPLYISSARDDQFIGFDLLGFETVASATRRKKHLERNSTQERFMFKFFLRLLAENAFQIHVQITIAGLSIALTGWTPAVDIMLISIYTTFVVLLFKFCQLWPDFWLVFESFKSDMPAKVVFLNVLLAAFVVVAYALAKILALFVCPQHLLNFDGCAEFDV